QFGATRRRLRSERSKRPGERRENQVVARAHGIEEYPLSLDALMLGASSRTVKQRLAVRRRNRPSSSHAAPYATAQPRHREAQMRPLRTLRNLQTLATLGIAAAMLAPAPAALHAQAPAVATIRLTLHEGTS